MKHAGHFALLIMVFLSPLFLAPALAGQHAEHEQMMKEHTPTAKEPELSTLDDLAKEVRALRARVATLEALKPGFTNFMPDFAERFHVVHRAGDVGDWAVAAHEVAEMRRLTRISRHIDPKLGALMQTFMDGNLEKLMHAIEHGSDRSFQAALQHTLAGCNGCHAAAGSTIAVSLDVDESLSMRHPHLLRKSTVPEQHDH